LALRAPRSSLGAFGAQSRDHDLGAFCPEARGAGRVQQRLGIHLNVEIVDSSTRAADQVLMGLGPAVVERGARARIDPAREAKLDEQLERGIDGGSRRARQLVAHSDEDLVRGGVAGAPAQLPEDHVALRGGALAPAVQETGELV
jgi:hypothetical protein